MDEIEKAVKTLAKLSEDQLWGYTSDEENAFIEEWDTGVPLAWFIENGFALATEKGNQHIMDAYNAYTAEFGGNNE